MRTRCKKAQKPLDGGDFDLKEYDRPKAHILTPETTINSYLAVSQDPYAAKPWHRKGTRLATEGSTRWSEAERGGNFCHLIRPPLQDPEY